MSEHNPDGHGLGAIPSPLDERDFPIADLYALTGKPKAVTIPTTYRVPGELNPILDQGSTPQCVAFSSAGLKGTEDRIDQGQFFDWDTGTFFVQIGGGPNGAVVRDAFKQMLAAGYPVKVVGDAGDHKITSYYAVPLTLAEIQAAIMAFGPVVFGMTWLNSMFSPKSNGVLTVDDASGEAGGHAILCVGWVVIGGKTYLILRNSWGTSWGLSGEAYLPASSVADLVGEVWKAVDVLEPAPVSEVTVPSVIEWFENMPPRIADSRPTAIGHTNVGTSPTPLAPGESRFVLVAGRNGIPANATGVFVNLTVTQEQAKGWVSVTPIAPTTPYSNINFPAGDDRANLAGCALVNLGVFVHNGSERPTHFLLDSPGYTIPIPAA